MRFFVALLLILLFFSFIPSAFALPQPTGYVTDLADIFNATQEKNLKEWLINYYTAQNLEVFVATTNSKPTHAYAEKLLNYWHVGKPGLNNGLLILINAKGQVGIGAGKVVKLYLNNQDKKTLAKRIKAAHKGDLEKTVVQSLSLIDNYIKQKQQTIKKTYRLPRLGQLIVFLFFLSMAFLPWLGAVLSRDRSFYGGGLAAILIAFIMLILSGWQYSLIVASFLIPLGFLLDIIVTNNYKQTNAKKSPAWWAGGRWLP